MDARRPGRIFPSESRPPCAVSKLADRTSQGPGRRAGYVRRVVARTPLVPVEIHSLPHCHVEYPVLSSAYLLE